MKLNDAIKNFSGWRKFKVKAGTAATYERDLRLFCLFLRNPEIENVKLADIMEYLNGMAELGWDRNSFIVKTMAIRKLFEFYRIQGYQVINEELIPIPHKEFKIPRVADEEGYKKLLNAIPKNNDPRHIRNRAIIQLLWDTGARNGELCALDVSDLDLVRMRAVIKTEKSKGRRPIREIFWTSGTNESIKIWLEKRQHLATLTLFLDPAALFISVVTTRVGRRFTIKGLGEMMRRYSNRARIPYLNPHSFRHHMGHDVVKQGGSSADVMNILGHSSLASSTIYTMMTDKELESRYRKFKGT